MNTSTLEHAAARALRVKVSADSLTIDLVDGRTISVPVGWFPRLLHGSEKERNNWRLIGDGKGIHWTELDEDLSIEGLLAGRPSAESQASLEKWLDSRTIKRRRASKK